MIDPWLQLEVRIRLIVLPCSRCLTSSIVLASRSVVVATMYFAEAKEIATCYVCKDIFLVYRE